MNKALFGVGAMVIASLCVGYVNGKAAVRSDVRRALEQSFKGDEKIDVAFAIGDLNLEEWLEASKTTQK